MHKKSIQRSDYNVAAQKAPELTINTTSLTTHFSRRSIFQIPPYFFYIGKAFSVLEGIGLTNDDNYSVINACLPYISQRLIADKSEVRM